MFQHALLQRECPLQRGDDLGAAWMERKPIDVAESQPGPTENTSDGRRHMRLGERWDVAIEDHPEPLRVDRPAHDVERVGPTVLAAHFDRGDAAHSGLQNASGGTITEQRGGDDVRLGQLVEPERQRAKFDCDEQNDSAGAGLCHAGRDRQPADTAGATKSEHRHALNVGDEIPYCPATRASRLGVAMPVEEIVTTMSTSAAVRPAASSALVAASMNNWPPPSR